MNDQTWIQLMEAGRKLGCHQMPERSFFFKGYQFPVCARCTGVIISALISMIVFLRKKIPIGVCMAMSGIMLTDWLLQYIKIVPSTNKRRLVTGLIGGFGYSTLHLYVYKFITDKILRRIPEN